MARHGRLLQMRLWLSSKRAGPSKVSQVSQSVSQCQSVRWSVTLSLSRSLSWGWLEEGEGVVVLVVVLREGSGEEREMPAGMMRG